MLKLRPDQVCHRRCHGAGRAGHRKDKGFAAVGPIPDDQAPDRPAKHRGGLDLFKAQQAEELAEPLQLDGQQPPDYLDRCVANRDTCSARRENHLDPGIRQPALQRCLDCPGLIFNERPIHRQVAGGAEDSLNERPTLVGADGAGVGDRQHRTADGPQIVCGAAAVLVGGA